MQIHTLSLRNFKCFGDEPVVINFEADITALIGNNGSGKTAVSVALQRLFGVSADERIVRKDDFHVPSQETEEPSTRTLSLEVIFIFPELADEARSLDAIPGFFAHMATDASGTFKCRLVLESTWTADGTVDGAIDTRLIAVDTLAPEFDDASTHVVGSAERSRVQFIYVPANRDGVNHVSTFLRGRLWKAARWSDDLRSVLESSTLQVEDKFQSESATRVAEAAFASRWKQLQGAGTHSTPRFTPLRTDVNALLRGTEIVFDPDPSATSREAHGLSDGQKSILHVALTAASLDIEEQLAADIESPFADALTLLPSLTILAIEEPENSLSPFYLSRIVSQLIELASSSRVQSFVATHSASAMTRISPTKVRYFRQDSVHKRSTVRSLTLPQDGSEAAKYVQEAVRAHPELYFARFVVLGEGDSEQVVLPLIARAVSTDFDPSFIAMVPLGGRHTQHFWTLLTDLQIPHATLLDLDLGRAGGGLGRVKAAVANLTSVGVTVSTGDGSAVLMAEKVTRSGLREAVQQLETVGVFFSSDLDLDMMMLEHFWDAYTRLEGSERGPDSSKALKSVLGTDGESEDRDSWLTREDSLRWYRYLFSNRSKPATHLRAIAHLSRQELAAAPVPLLQLIQFASSRVVEP